MKKTLKKFISKFRFYNKKQEYSIKYQVTLKNLLSENNSFFVVLPLTPQIEPTLTPQPKEIKTDSKFKNKYALWEINLAPQATKELTEEFTISVAPQKQLLSEKFILSDYQKIDSKYSLYLQPNKYLSPDNEKIKQTAQNIIGSEKDIIKIIKKLNNYVISTLKYANPIPGLYTAQEALEKKDVDCGGFDTLLGSLCMSLGIPSRIVSGFWAGYPDNQMHAWLEILLPNEQWIPADPSIEHLGSKKSGRLGFVGSDRIKLSHGCDIPVEVNNKVVHLDILQNPYSSSKEVAIETKFITQNV